MVSKDYTFFSYVFLATTVILLTANGAGLCDNAPNKQVCYSIVYTRTNPHDVVVAACHKLISEIKVAKLVAQRQPKSTEIDTCISEFDDAIATTKEALGFLEDNGYTGLIAYINGTLLNYQQCNDAFENYGKTNPIAKSTNHLEDLAITGAYLATLIKG